MSKLRRVANIALSLLMVACGIMFLCDPKDGLVLAAVAFGIWLLVSGLRKLWYYFTMARHMVGGLSVLFYGVIALDIGGLALMLVSEPRFAVALYLIGYNAFTAIIGIVRVVESKMIDSHWMMSLAHSIVNLVLAGVCIIYISSDVIVMVIFCIWLFYTAIMRFIRAVRPTEIIYIK